MGASSSSGVAAANAPLPQLSRSCRYKLLLIGDSGVGKSELVHRFQEDNLGKLSTLGQDFRIRTVELDGKSIKLQIWDTAGQEQFHTITSSYYRGTQGIMLVYDATNQTSFDNIEHWLRNINDHMADGVAKVLVGNRCDETTKKQVEYTRAKEYADKLGIPLLEVSADSKADVEQAFMALVAEIQNRIK